MISSNTLNDPNFINDKAFQKISGKLVKLKKREIKANNGILKNVVLTKIVQLMKAKDKYFKAAFEDVNYSGSFYKNLKVSKPDEYDLLLVVKLPIDYDLLEIEPDRTTPGYVKIRILEDEDVLSRNNNFWCSILNGEYLDQNKYRSWIQSVFDRALTDFQQDPETNEYFVKSRKKKTCYKFKYRQSGPAFTINVASVHDDREISFDLVPCLLFRDKPYLPGFRSCNGQKWFAIAKPLRHDYVGDDSRLLWRAGFYEEEKRLLAGHNKPVIRIIKKLRDIKGWHQLKSYFIETLFLHELNNNPYFACHCDRSSRTNVLMHMLRILQQKLSEGVLLSYWHEGLNMLADLPRLQEIANELQTIINRIDNNIVCNKEILLTIYELKN